MARRKYKKVSKKITKSKKRRKNIRRKRKARKVNRKRKPKSRKVKRKRKIKGGGESEEPTFFWKHKIFEGIFGQKIGNEYKVLTNDNNYINFDDFIFEKINKNEFLQLQNKLNQEPNSEMQESEQNNHPAFAVLELQKENEYNPGLGMNLNDSDYLYD